MPVPSPQRGSRAAGGRHLVLEFRPFFRPFQMRRSSPRNGHIKTFAFAPGDQLAEKYEIVSLLGRGWEGEVYKLREARTGIEHAAKFFFPHRNPRDRAARFYAKKLHKLRHCPILIQYHTQERIPFDGQKITCLVSEYVEGELL